MRYTKTREGENHGPMNSDEFKNIPEQQWEAIFVCGLNRNKIIFGKWALVIYEYVFKKRGIVCMYSMYVCIYVCVCIERQECTHTYVLTV